MATIVSDFKIATIVSQLEWQPLYPNWNGNHYISIGMATIMLQLG